MPTVAAIETLTKALLQDPDGVRFPGGSGSALRSAIGEACLELWGAMGGIEEDVALAAIGASTVLYEAPGVNVATFGTVYTPTQGELYRIGRADLPAYDVRWATATGSPSLAVTWAPQATGQPQVRLYPDPGAQLTDVRAVVRHTPDAPTGDTDVPRLPDECQRRLHYGAAIVLARGLGEYAELSAAWLEPWAKAQAAASAAGFTLGTHAPRFIRKKAY